MPKSYYYCCYCKLAYPAGCQTITYKGLAQEWLRQDGPDKEWQKVEWVQNESVFILEPSNIVILSKPLAPQKCALYSVTWSGSKVNALRDQCQLTRCELHEMQTVYDKIESFYGRGWECVGEVDAKSSAPKWWRILQTNGERNHHPYCLIVTLLNRTIISRHPTPLCPLRQGTDAKWHLVRIRRCQRNLTNRQCLTSWDENEMKRLKDSGGWKKQRKKNWTVSRLWHFTVAMKHNCIKQQEKKGLLVSITKWQV